MLCPSTCSLDQLYHHVGFLIKEFYASLTWVYRFLKITLWQWGFQKVWCWLTLPRRWGWSRGKSQRVWRVWCFSGCLQPWPWGQLSCVRISRLNQGRADFVLLGQKSEDFLEVFLKAFGMMGSSGKQRSFQPCWVYSWCTAEDRGLFRSLTFRRAL